VTFYPLLFSRRELVEGNGFVAGVSVSGRALLEEEGEGEFWVEGVNPGGLSAQGSTPSDALAEFCSSLKAVLFDIAAEARDFDGFREEVIRFFNDVSVPALKDWETAVEQVRAGRITADWLAKRPADSRLGIEVAKVHHPAPTNNQLGETALAA
jgi:predicted RNase H-like HicB family nuclease